MLLSAALLTLLLAAMHSVLGGRRLIAPLVKQDKFPIILGSEARARITLRVGWHVLSLMWVGIAALLAAMHFGAAATSQAFLIMVATTFGLSGIAAFWLSQARHLSWVLFLPIAALCAMSAA